MADRRSVRVAHLTTVDLSLRFLLLPQLMEVVERGGEAVGISAPGPWGEELASLGVRHVPLPSSTRGMDLVADLRSAWELWRVLTRERPDVLHTHNPKPGLYGRVVGRLAGVPIVVNTVHGLYATETDPLPKRLLVYLMEALASRFSDAELVQNPEDLDLLMRFHISPRSRTRLLGNGIDLERFDPARVSSDLREELRRELGAGPDQIVVGTVGRLVVEKGYPELFEAARRLGDGYLVVCIGPHDPEKADALPDAMLESARRSGVRFLGMRTDVERLYRSMDVFVLPSHREGFPRTPMEAAAMGVPVVATDIRGCRQVVEHGVNGLLVPVGDPVALAEAIRAIGEDSERRVAMGEAGRQRALAEFDERRVVASVMDTYDRVAARKGLVEVRELTGDGGDSLRLRSAGMSDVPALAHLHRTGIDTGFLAGLGIRFLRRLYRALVRWPEAVVMVAEDGDRVVGFVAGVEDTGRFYRNFLLRHGPMAALAAFPRLLHPRMLWRAWETLRYGTVSAGGTTDVGRAELLSMAVVAHARGRGIGYRLGNEFLHRMQEAGVDRMKVVVGTDNGPAIAAYAKMGFQRDGIVEVHGREISEVMVWSA